MRQYDSQLAFHLPRQPTESPGNLPVVPKASTGQRIGSFKNLIKTYRMGDKLTNWHRDFQRNGKALEKLGI